MKKTTPSKPNRTATTAQANPIPWCLLLLNAIRKKIEGSIKTIRHSDIPAISPKTSVRSSMTIAAKLITMRKHVQVV